jgi:hypothetical protein
MTRARKQGRAFAAGSGARIGEGVELGERAAHQLARPHAGIHQPLDRTQLGDLLGRVQAFGVVVAQRIGKAVTAFPHAQDVFRQPDLSLDRADIQRQPEVSAI